MDRQPHDPMPYKGLGTLLHIVRWSQHFLSIIAEVLILVSFAMSGMDVSLGGSMAAVPLLKVLWAAMFALGIDTAFVLSWVRVRQHLMRRQWGRFVSNLVLAFSMSLITFEPIAIQLFQQALNLNFNQAVTSLGINIVFLTYARAGVAVFLGAILAVTNTVDEATKVQDAPRQHRQFVGSRILRRCIPFRTRKQPALAVPVTVNEERPATEAVAPAELPAATEEAASEQADISTEHVETPAQPEPSPYDTPEQRVQKVNEMNLASLSAPERAAKVLELFPDLSDRELGKLSGMAAATAKKYREALKRQKIEETANDR